MILKSVIGIVLGGGLGFAYYYFVGCQSGTCAIQSNPYTMTIYGSVLGLILTYTGTSKKESKQQASDK